MGLTAWSFAMRYGLSPSGLSGPSGTVTRAQAVEAMVAVAGLPASLPVEPTYTDVPTSSPAYNAVEAAVAGGLMPGWVSTSGAFEPSAPISRIDLAILATNAMAVQTQAANLIRDTTTYGRLRDLGATGYDLGFANAMLKDGIVPPLDATRYDPQGAVTGVTLAIALYRIWHDLDVPVTATITPQTTDVLRGQDDALAFTVTNRLGTSVPSNNLTMYFPGYTVTGSYASYGQVTGGQFTAHAPGAYVVSAALSGPLLAKPLTVTTDIQVFTPYVLAAPAQVTATEVSGGVQVQWSPGSGVYSYQILEALRGSNSYTDGAHVRFGDGADHAARAGWSLA